MSYKDDLTKFIRDPARRNKTATIGPYTFYLNPDSISGDTVQSHLEYVTLNGGGSFRYPVMPEIWTLSGHTGIKGADELEKMYGATAPVNTRTATLLPFEFKPLFSQTLNVLINRFNRSMSNDRHLYCHFTMELLVMPKPRPESFKLINRVSPAGSTSGIGARATP